jgi:mRNA interferase MazF
VDCGYVPDCGELVWLSFAPQSGHEQSGSRPAIVISPKLYNERSGLAVFCPVTSRVKGYPFEVRLPEGAPVQGVILADQLKSLDWKARHAERIGKSSAETMQEVMGRIRALLF